ncbi:MAG TPA: hypothetical protein VGU23_02530 [Acidobacteriaceae bacterium]|nr:hypothetical protein [Acidobacteriaceae bacterium]
MKFASIAFVAALTFAPAALIAQAPADTTTPPKHDPTINQREENQQDRIGQGVTSGQLTAHETAKLEGQEAGIDKEEAGMKAEDNGKLTKQDRKTLNKQLNQESRRIYRDKHNSRVQK